jgi:hypothetical protein
MTDTATEAPAKRVQKPRDVDYTLEIVDDLPDLEVQRRSPLEDQIKRIIDTPESHNRFVRIASYANGSAASAAANQLRKRHGDKEAVDGYTVRTKRLATEDDAEPRTGLFVRFNPDAIVPGARDEFDTRMKEREQKIESRRAERAALKNDVDAAVADRKTQTPREKSSGAGQTSGTAAAAGSKSPGA